MIERLEEIKEEYRDAIRVIGIARKDIDYLIQQAELSREWQLVATDRFNDWYKADQLNNRYKQAIENSLDRLKSGGAGTRSIVKGYLEKALEESE